MFLQCLSAIFDDFYSSMFSFDFLNAPFKWIIIKVMLNYVEIVNRLVHIRLRHQYLKSISDRGSPNETL